MRDWVAVFALVVLLGLPALAFYYYVTSTPRDPMDLQAAWVGLLLISGGILWMWLDSAARVRSRDGSGRRRGRRLP